MAPVLTGSGYVVATGVCAFTIANHVGTFDSISVNAIVCTSAAVITRVVVGVGVTMFVAAASRGSAISAGAAAAFGVTYGFA